MAIVLHFSDATAEVTGKREIGANTCEQAQKMVEETIKRNYPGVQYEIKRAECHTIPEWLALSGEPI